MKKLLVLLALAIAAAPLLPAQSMGRVLYGNGVPGVQTPDCTQTLAYINSLTGDVYTASGTPCAWVLTSGALTSANVVTAVAGQPIAPASETLAAEYNNGTCTTAKTISAANGNNQRITLTNADACALTFTQPSTGTMTIRLKIVQSAAGSFNGTITGGKWPGGTVPTITATTGAVDSISCYLDGTSAYCVATQNFQ
jgi:hypothetical protein